jgi:hypothetical protein
MGSVDSQVVLLLVALLLAKHFLCDFVLQNGYQLSGKHQYGHPGGLLHASIHALGTAAVLAFFPVSWAFLLGAAAAEFVVHYHIDWAKGRITRRATSTQGLTYWGLFGFDQLLHQLTYVAIAALA